MGFLKEAYTREYYLSGTKKYGVPNQKAFREGSLSRKTASILKQVNFKEKVVLDIGFGRGEALKWALDEGALKVHGVDFAPAAVDIAKEHLEKWHPEGDWSIECHDALEYLVKKAYKELFDIVIMFDSIEHIPNDEVEFILPLMKKSMKQNALFLVITPFYKVREDYIKQGMKYIDPSKSDKIFPGMHNNKYTRSALIEQLIRHGFERIDEENGPRQMPETHQIWKSV